MFCFVLSLQFIHSFVNAFIHALVHTFINLTLRVILHVFTVLTNKPNAKRHNLLKSVLFVSKNISDLHLVKRRHVK